MHLVDLYQPPTFNAVGIVAVRADGAERTVFVAAIVLDQNTFATALTYAGLRLVADPTQFPAIEQKSFLDRVRLLTMGTGKGFVHGCFPPRFYNFCYDALL